VVPVLCSMTGQLLADLDRLDAGHGA